MACETYVEKTFSSGSMEVIDQANTIIAGYRAQGFTLTLRQLYYQFVARGLLENKQRNYKRLGSIMKGARLAGLVDWNAIEDRTRSLRRIPHWDSPEELISSCAEQFAYDKWADQPYRIEVWIEKDALVGVIEDACHDLDVPFFSCRGYTSISEQWRAGRRLRRYAENGQKIIIFHLGDHDPSGIDMTRDNRDSLDLFTYGISGVKRLALNMDQVKEFNPPPNIAKMSDSRALGYVTNYGEECWELDALDPPVIDKLIRDAIAGKLDTDLWEAAVAREAEARSLLGEVSDNWSEIVAQFGGSKP